MSMPSKLKKVQHLVHYFQRRNGTELAEMTTQWGHEWKLIRQCCTRGTHGISRTLQTENKAALGPVTKELRAPSLKPQLPQGPGPRPVLTLPSMCLVLEKEQCSFSVHQGLEGKIPKPWSQAITRECFFSIHPGHRETLSSSVQPSTGMACCSVLKDSQCGWQSDTMDLIQSEAKRGDVTWPETGAKVWVSRDHDESWRQSNYGTDMTKLQNAVGWDSWRDHR